MIKKFHWRKIPAKQITKLKKYLFLLFVQKALFRHLFILV